MPHSLLDDVLPPASGAYHSIARLICVALAAVLSHAVIAGAQVSAVPPESQFVVPAPNACQSSYDQFYINEPDVYAYWALCELGSNPSLYDYARRFDPSPASNAWSSGAGSIQGLVPDTETATQVTNASSFIANQDIPLNTNQGPLALRVDTSSPNYPVAMIFRGSLTGKSFLTVQVSTPPTSECFTGRFSNSYASAFTTPPACGDTPNVWRRIVFTWKTKTTMLYIDGARVSSFYYGGALDDPVFVYRLFSESVPFVI
jgi:hypothetical protein